MSTRKRLAYNDSSKKSVSRAKQVAWKHGTRDPEDTPKKRTPAGRPISTGEALLQNAARKEAINEILTLEHADWVRIKREEWKYLTIVEKEIRALLKLAKWDQRLLVERIRRIRG